MSVFGPGDPHDPHVRTALEVMRVVAAGILLALIAWLAIDRQHGGYEYFLALLGALGAILGLPVLARLIKKG